MSDAFESSVERTVVPQRGRAVGRGFVEDLDRIFLYRVLSVHLSAGVEPAKACRTLSVALSREEGDESPVVRQRRERRKLGADRLAEAFVKAGEGDPEASLAKAVVDAGMVLTPEEEACLSFPCEVVDRLPLLAEALSTVALLMQEQSRR